MNVSHVLSVSSFLLIRSKCRSIWIFITVVLKVLCFLHLSHVIDRWRVYRLVVGSADTCRVSRGKE